MLVWSPRLAEKEICKPGENQQNIEWENLKVKLAARTKMITVKECVKEAGFVEILEPLNFI